MEVPSACAEDMGARAYALGSCGLQAEELGERTRLSVYFAISPELDFAAIEHELGRFAAEFDQQPTSIASELIEERDWEEEWRRFFQPVWATPRIVVHPSWIPVSVEEEQIAVIIDPKMAFGTGGHESTQLCLAALEDHLLTGARCLDLGAGSGILSIAAALLGAKSVLAVDIDPVAVANARENIARNRIGSEQVEVRLGSTEVVEEESFDLILANIQSQVLRPLLTPLRSALAEGGCVLFSGLLGREGKDFCESIRAAELRVETILEKGEWICIVAKG